MGRANRKWQSLLSTSAAKRILIGKNRILIGKTNIDWLKYCKTNTYLLAKIDFVDIDPLTGNISIEKFGASAPYQKLYETYGLTAKKILKKINNKI